MVDPERPNEKTWFDMMKQMVGVESQTYTTQEFKIATKLNGNLLIPTPNDYLQFMLTFVVNELNGKMLPHAFKHFWESFEK